mmetsp:Transcript_773/g.941  ORF Transcript_773/g.941 Transcript_773/m.941 type:complete len:224 (+) Transcript_773:203-874(+)
MVYGSIVTTTSEEKKNDTKLINVIYGLLMHKMSILVFWLAIVIICSIGILSSSNDSVSSDEAHQMYNRLGEIMPSKTYRDDILSTAHSLCDAFANKAPLNEVLDQFSTSDEVFCLEHGLQRLAPFLGRIFVGQEGVKQYFTIISDLLSYDDMKFSDYIVDVDASTVSVRGEATFLWKSTGNSWEEVFTYRLRFDDEAKVLAYEVWADSGAAFLASKGLLHDEE